MRNKYNCINYEFQLKNIYLCCNYSLEYVGFL
jgi:hypothetical protein